MAYTKHTWTDGTESDPSKGTVINASKLDEIEDELEYLDTQLSEVNQSLTDIGIRGTYMNMSGSTSRDIATLSFGQYALIVENRSTTGRSGIYLCYYSDGISAAVEDSQLDVTYNNNIITVTNNGTSIYLGVIIIG